jgi:anti-sigma B factor antagonist
MGLADVRYAERDGVLIASVTGEIDMSNDDALRLEVEDRLGNGALGLVVDLSGVGYLDSSGIHLLYQLADRLNARGQRIAIVVPEDSPVEATLRFAGALEEIGALRTVAEAERSLRD